jgi:hypothetical protein
MNIKSLSNVTFVDSMLKITKDTVVFEQFVTHCASQCVIVFTRDASIQMNCNGGSWLDWIKFLLGCGETLPYFVNAIRIKDVHWDRFYNIVPIVITTTTTFAP